MGSGHYDTNDTSKKLWFPWLFLVTYQYYDQNCDNKIKISSHKLAVSFLVYWCVIFVAPAFDINRSNGNQLNHNAIESTTTYRIMYICTEHNIWLCVSSWISLIISNHQAHDCQLNYLFRRLSKKASRLCVTGLCEGNSPVTGEFPAQRASNAKNVSIWWRQHGHEPFYLDTWLIQLRFLMISCQM